MLARQREPGPDNAAWSTLQMRKLPFLILLLVPGLTTADNGLLSKPEDDVVVSAGRMFILCNRYPPSAKQETWCEGYLAGLADNLVVAQRLGYWDAKVCFPKSLRTGDSRQERDDAVFQAFKRWMLKHPEQTSSPGALVALNAMQSSFPCPP